MADGSEWIGREERRRDRIDAGAHRRWLATLDRDAPADGAVAQGYHWCLCLPDAPSSALGADGHPRRDESPDSFLPPLPQPRRMWASSRVEFLAPLRVGDDVGRTSRIESIAQKQGASGPLAFVEVLHEMTGPQGPAVREVQSLVYRDPPPTGAPPAPPPPGPAQFDPSGWDAHRIVTPDEALLFRFSALTFNSHRIHYDAPYAIGVEGYRGLVVHGPLTATLLLDLARRELGDNALATFAFRGVSPAIGGEALHFVMRGSGADIEFGAFAGDGREVMRATASA